MELTILMPCLNEEKTIVECIRKAKSFLATENLNGEVLIADNNSSDSSVSLAQKEGARVVVVKQQGYGAALLQGIQAAAGCYVIMGDADNSYDFSTLMPFVVQLRGGCDLVIGNRFKGEIMPGAMPFLNRYLGNPLLSFIGRILFNCPIQDFHCGLRGFNRLAISRLNLKTTGMEFASEMIVKAALKKLSITEVPIILAPDGRQRVSHLRRWQDGWRHLFFLISTRLSYF